MRNYSLLTAPALARGQWPEILTGLEIDHHHLNFQDDRVLGLNVAPVLPEAAHA